MQSVISTPELKELEDTILGCRGQAVLHWNMICSVRSGMRIADRDAENPDRQPQAIARLDVFASLAFVAEQNHYVQPEDQRQRA